MADKSTRRKAKWVVAWIMFAGGLAGFIGAATGLLAPGEPRFVHCLSWAAIWVEGGVALIAADDS